MAGAIRVLDEGVINRISAGEVVERPVSVVKELVENSLDAQASHITVEIEMGGRKLVRVKDNGTGMSHDDAFLALERHATSKLRSEKDLHAISTMGFRGEALASIASVSRLRLVTADDEASGGTEIVIEGGVLRKSDPVGMGRGTMIDVRNLFYNVPVRRKFLRPAPDEAARVYDLVTRLALAFPEIGFHYAEDGKVKIDVPPARSTFERIHSLYPKDVRESLVELDHQVGDVRLHGFVARPPYARSNMRSVLTFVNRRAVRDRLINAAVNRAFTNLVERGRYPFAILFIDLPPADVDVNVHPQKAEVRFPRPQIISGLILDGVHQALIGAPFKPPPGPREPMFPTAPSTPLSRHLRDERPAEAPSFVLPAPIAPRAETTTPTRIAPQGEPPSPATAPHETGYSSLRVLGRLPGSFLVLHNDRELVVMDQHAAHERVLFEDLQRGDRETRKFASQSLLIPTVLQYSPVEARALAAHLDLLHNAGFLVEEFGENDFVVKGVPAWLGESNVEDLFQGLIDVLLDSGLRGDPSRLRTDLLKTMACRAAIKEPGEMRPEEIRALLSDLDRTSSPEVCPHGRPLCMRLPLDEIRRKLGRK
ncbi:MAG: DNA mismatch repair endonuclease MutL [Desulfomonile tiedjei]|nr:DNA mismatch repair endonuclease MutL [Desulfomonile tiedjei]